MRLNKVLIQGGWPWLRGYNKTFAKAVFLVTVSLFGALELGYVNAGVAEDLTALARLLVGRDGSGWPLRVRKNHRLHDKKVRVAAAEKKNVSIRDRRGRDVWFPEADRCPHFAGVKAISPRRLFRKDCSCTHLCVKKKKL